MERNLLQGWSIGFVHYTRNQIPLLILDHHETAMPVRQFLPKDTYEAIIFGASLKKGTPLIFIWAEEALTVKMNKMCRGLGDPDLCFPRNIVEVFYHRSAVKKCRHKD